MRFLVALLFLAFLWVMGMSNTPAVMQHAGGATPEIQTYKHRCVFEEGGLTSCESPSFFRWRLSAGGARLATTWSLSREDSVAVIGVLTHEHPNCPESRLEWTITTNGDTNSGTLTPQNPTVELNIAVHEPLWQLALALRRLDATACPSTLKWDLPGLDKPAFSLAPAWPG